LTTLQDATLSSVGALVQVPTDTLKQDLSNLASRLCILRQATQVVFSRLTPLQNAKVSSVGATDVDPLLLIELPTIALELDFSNLARRLRTTIRRQAPQVSFSRVPRRLAEIRTNSQTSATRATTTVAQQTAQLQQQAVAVLRQAQANFNITFQRAAAATEPRQPAQTLITRSHLQAFLAVESLVTQPITLATQQAASRLCTTLHRQAPQVSFSRVHRGLAEIRTNIQTSATRATTTVAHQTAQLQRQAVAVIRQAQADLNITFQIAAAASDHRQLAQTLTTRHHFQAFRAVDSLVTQPSAQSNSRLPGKKGRARQAQSKRRKRDHQIPQSNPASAPQSFNYALFGSISAVALIALVVLVPQFLQKDRQGD
jgi:hypothetical protein